MTRWCLVLVVMTACSFSLDGPDPKRPARTAPTCETGKGRVLTDGLLATTMALATVSIGASSGAAAILPAVIGAVFVGSAIHGNNVVEDCRKANVAYAALDPTPQPPVVAEDPEPLPVAAPPALAAPPVPAVVPTPAAWAAFWKEVR
ncbi:MAG: hypothetical protein ABI591_21395 [Kofleriaceae bacterium]